MDALVEQLGLNFKLLFIQIVGFLVLYWLLKKFLFGRIMDMIQKRGNEIRAAYEENEQTQNDLNALKEQYEKKLQEVQQQAESIIQDAAQQAEKTGQEIIEKTRQEANLIKEKGLAEIEQEKKRVIAEIRADVVNLSIEIASRIIAKNITAQEAEQLSDDIIEKIGGMPS